VARRRRSPTPRDSPFLVTPSGHVPEELRLYSEQRAERIDAEVRRILATCDANAKAILLEHRPAVDALARALLDKETLDEAEIREVTGLTPARRSDALPVPIARAAFSIPRDGGLAATPARA
jgi:cell division protease FtsH